MHIEKPPPNVCLLKCLEDLATSVKKKPTTPRDYLKLIKSKIP